MAKASGYKMKASTAVAVGHGRTGGTAAGAARGRKGPASMSAAFHAPNDEGGKFVNRDLTKVNPLMQQFEPTPAEPVRRRFKMAGGC